MVELSEEYDREDERYYKSRLELAESVEEKISCLLNLGQEEKVMELYQQEKDELKSRHLLQDLQKLYAKRDNIDEVLLIHLSLNKYIEAWHELIRNYERVSMEFKKKHLKILLTEAIRRGLVKQLFADVTKLRVTKTELVLLLLCEVVASKQTDSDDLMLTHKLVNDFFEETNPLVVEKFDNNQLISASLAYERIDCRRKDLLPFYEELLARGDLEPKTKRFIRERWLYIKSKHTDDRSRYKKEARQELDERQNEWQIQKIPTGIPYLEDVVKRFGGLKKDPNMAAAPAKQEIQLKVDVDRNFEYEDILEGDFNEKKNEFRIQLNLKTKPEQIVVEIGDKRFNLPLKG